MLILFCTTSSRSRFFEGEHVNTLPQVSVVMPSEAHYHFRKTPNIISALCERPQYLARRSLAAPLCRDDINLLKLTVKVGQFHFA